MPVDRIDPGGDGPVAQPVATVGLTQPGPRQIEAGQRSTATGHDPQHRRRDRGGGEDSVSSPVLEVCGPHRRRDPIPDRHEGPACEDQGRPGPQTAQPASEVGQATGIDRRIGDREHVPRRDPAGQRHQLGAGRVVDVAADVALAVQGRLEDRSPGVGDRAGIVASPLAGVAMDREAEEPGQIVATPIDPDGLLLPPPLLDPTRRRRTGIGPGGGTGIVVEPPAVLDAGHHQHVHRGHPPPEGGVVSWGGAEFDAPIRRSRSEASEGIHTRS